MYRQGLGDCFLTSLPRTDGSKRPFYVMIDCGVVLGTPDSGTIMNQVMDNIIEVTGGGIDLFIATHPNWCDPSGFVPTQHSFCSAKTRPGWFCLVCNPVDDIVTTLLTMTS